MRGSASAQSAGASSRKSLARTTTIGDDNGAHHTPRRLDLAVNGSCDPLPIVAMRRTRAIPSQRTRSLSCLPCDCEPPRDGPCSQSLCKGPLQGPLCKGRSAREALQGRLCKGGSARKCPPDRPGNGSVGSQPKRRSRSASPDEGATCLNGDGRWTPAEL
jgi:hypothetical protein